MTLTETLAALRNARNAYSDVADAVAEAEAPHVAAAKEASSQIRGLLADLKEAVESLTLAARAEYTAAELTRQTALKAGVDTPPQALPTWCSVRRTQAAVVTNEALVPREFMRVDQAALKRALTNGEVPGAELVLVPSFTLRAET